MFLTLIFSLDEEEMLEYQMVFQEKSEAIVYTAKSIAEVYQINAEKNIDLFLFSVSEFSQAVRINRQLEMIKMISNDIRNIFKPKIIISDTDQYARQAYDSFHCYQYLKRPVNANFFRTLVNAMIYNKSMADDQVLFLRERGSWLIEDTSRILYLESINRKIVLHKRDNNTEIVYHSFEKLLHFLLRKFFFQCHRSFVVNRIWIAEVDLKRNYIILHNGEKIAIGPKYKQNLLSYYTLLEHSN